MRARLKKKLKEMEDNKKTKKHQLATKVEEAKQRRVALEGIKIREVKVVKEAVVEAEKQEEEPRAPKEPESEHSTDSESDPKISPHMRKKTMDEKKAMLRQTH
jgi:hypothetical protein